MRQASDLRPYQQGIVDDLYNHDVRLLIAGLGSGKTAATATALAERLRDGVIRHAIVMSTKRVTEMVWPREVQEWSHLTHLRWSLLNGSPARRAAELAEAHRRDLTFISFDHAVWLAEALHKLPQDHPLFDCIVLDETSRLKSPKSVRAKALRGLAPKFRTRLGLTATPRPNGLEDLFMPTAVLTDGKLWGNSFYAWRQKHFYPTDYQGYNWRPLPGHDLALMNEVATIATILAESDMPDLPKLNLLIDRVRLPDDVREIYDDMERKLVAELEGGEILAASAGVASGKCAQICQGFIYGDGNEDVTELHTLKDDWIADLVETLDGEPLLIIYEFIEDLRRLQAMWPGLPYLGNSVTSAQAAKHVDAWNAGKLPLLAMHAASGGHGLNLQFGGSRMAWYGLTWSAELYEQTVGRIFRPGQENRVHIHLCLAEETIDELKRLRVVDKMKSQDAFAAYLRRRKVRLAA